MIRGRGTPIVNATVANAIWEYPSTLFIYFGSIGDRNMDFIVDLKIDEHRCKQCRVYLDFGQAGSLSLQLYCAYHTHRLLHVHVAVNSHVLLVYKKNRIASTMHI